MTKQNPFSKAIRNNDIKQVRLLLNDKEVVPSLDLNFPIQLASKNGYIDIVELLLKDKRVDPSDSCNLSIRLASKKCYIDIVELLWKNKLVKKTLKNDNEELYNKLIQQDIKNKVSKF
jgi:ankyrin repeat protein